MLFFYSFCYILVIYSSWIVQPADSRKLDRDSLQNLMMRRLFMGPYPVDVSHMLDEQQEDEKNFGTFDDKRDAENVNDGFGGSQRLSDQDAFFTLIDQYLQDMQRSRRMAGDQTTSCRGRCYCYSKVSHRSFCCDCMTGPCFPGSSSVILYPTMEKMKMDQLHIGDQVSTVLDGEVVGTKVVSFLDRRPDEIAEYVQVSVIDGATLSISSGHIVYVVDGNIIKTMYSGDLKVGDHLMMMSLSNGSVSPSEITNISRDLMKGAYVPLTSTGHLLVDSHLVSSYSSFPHDLSHLVFMPLRLGLLPESLTSAYVGMMKVLGRALLPSSLISTHHAIEIEKVKDGNNFDQQMSLDRNNIKIGFCPLSPAVKY